MSHVVGAGQIFIYTFLRLLQTGEERYEEFTPYRPTPTIPCGDRLQGPHAPPPQIPPTCPAGNSLRVAERRAGGATADLTGDGHWQGMRLLGESIIFSTRRNCDRGRGAGVPVCRC